MLQHFAIFLKKSTAGFERGASGNAPFCRRCRIPLSIAGHLEREHEFETLKGQMLEMGDVVNKMGPLFPSNLVGKLRITFLLKYVSDSSYAEGI